MRLTLAIFALAASLFAQTAPTDSHLPIKRVVLYKNGVGYFEHVGKVRGTEDVNIDFTSSQLDDVIKSLTIVDYGEGRVTGVRYNSTAPLEQRLRGLRIPLSANPTREELLNALRGARVDVRSGTASASGKILSVESRERVNSRTDEKTTVTELSIITDAGELRSFELGTGTSIRIADRDLSQELARYLTMVGSSRAKDVRRMTLTASGTGERDLFVSYISEVPVWKTTYRIVIPTDPKKQPLLQGWAVVDNTIGEDWKDVKLSLVAGAPQSFVQQISTPYYARRPVVALPQTAQLAPQLSEASLVTDADKVAAVSEGVVGGLGSGYKTVPPPPPAPAIGGAFHGTLNKSTYSACSLFGQVVDPMGAVITGSTVTATNSQGQTRTATTDNSGAYCLYGLSNGNWNLRVESPGFTVASITNLPVYGRSTQRDVALNVGTAAETVEVSADRADVATRNTYLEDQFESAGGREIGELFSYDIKQPITIGKDQSALVPIVQSRVDAMKVTVWNSDSSVPRNALWLKNTSGATLDSGSFSITEGDSFAGEGLLDPIKPGERRLLSYAGDSAVKVENDTSAADQPITHISIIRGLMRVTRQRQSTETYTVRNNDKEARNVVIEHPARQGWKFVKDLKPEESSESFHRFLVKVEPNSESTLEVAEYHPEQTELFLSNLTADDIMLYSRQRVLKPEVEDAFRKILDQKNKISGIDQQIRLREQEMNNISSDQSRVRENMKALKGSAEEKALLQRYATQLNSQEDRINALRTELETIRKQRESASQDLNSMLMSLNFEEDFPGK